MDHCVSPTKHASIHQDGVKPNLATVQNKMKSLPMPETIHGPACQPLASKPSRMNEKKTRRQHEAMGPVTNKTAWGSKPCLATKLSQTSGAMSVTLGKEVVNHLMSTFDIVMCMKHHDVYT